MNSSHHLHPPSTECSDANEIIAWTEPKNPKAQKARRVKVWLKKSITNLASPSAVEFDCQEDPVTRGSFRRDAASRPLHRTSSTSSILSTTTSRETTTTIDQAMFSLYTYVGPKKKVSSILQVAPETPSSYVPACDHDWLLDGKSEWKRDDATSQEYLTFLNQPWDMEAYLETYLQEREQTIQREQQEEEEAFQFEANFDSSACNASDTEGKHSPRENQGDSDDDFGDFQEATPSESNLPAKDNNMFQTPHPTEGNNAINDTCIESKAIQNLGSEFDQEVGATDIEQDNEHDNNKRHEDEKSSKDSSDEEKSQEEVIVEEAVDILKSLPSKDFNEICGSVTKKRVLMETCNLASELENEEAENDTAHDMEPQTTTDNEQKEDSCTTGQENENDEALPDGPVTQEEEATSPGAPPQVGEPQEEATTSHGPIHKVASSSSTRAELSSGEAQDATQSTASGPPGTNNIATATASYSDDDSFGDFQDASASTEVEKPAATTHDNDLTEVENHGNTSNAAHLPVRSATTTNESLHSSPSAGQGPTFAVLPPLKVDTAAKVQQQAEHHLHTTLQPETQQTIARTHATPPTPAIEDCMESVSEMGDDMSADDNDDGDEDEEIRISWRLPITDLSTPVARFSRRQRQKFKEALKLKQRGDLPPESIASIFSTLEKEDDDDDDGEPLLSLADLDLPHYYFTQADFDDTTRVLQNAPWHHIAHMWDLPEDQVMGLQIASSYSFEDQLDRQALWDEYITQELCNLDSAQNQVAKHLLRRIQPHGAVLQKANQGIFEFQTHLQLAQMYLRRGQASVRQAACGTFDPSSKSFDEGSGWFGAYELLHAWDRKETYSNLNDLLEEIQHIYQTEKSLQERCAEYTFQADKPREYYTLTQQIMQLQSAVTGNASLSQVIALNDLRIRLERNELLRSFHSRLHTLAEWVAVRCCRARPQGLSAEYAALLEGAMEVHSVISAKTVDAESDNIPTHDVEDDAEIPKANQSSSIPVLTSSWTETVLEALCYEADRAFATALLDPLVDQDIESADPSIDSEYERELTQLAYEIQQDWGDSARLTTITHNLVIIRFDWENSSRYFPPVYHRLCRTLADVLYAHHVIGQWHERLIKALASCVLPMEESKEEKKEMNDEKLQHPSTHGHNGGDKSVCSEHQKIVEEIHSKWSTSKSVIWQRCEASLFKCLDEYLHFASNQNFFKETATQSSNQDQTEASVDSSCMEQDSRWRQDLEELQNVFILTQQFGSLKARFFDASEMKSNDDHSTNASALGVDLTDKLCDVFRKHLRFVHVEAMKGLGASLSQEDWELVPLEQLSDFEKSVHRDETVSLKELLVGVLSDATQNIDKGKAPNTRRRSLFLHPPSTNRFLLHTTSSDPISSEALAKTGLKHHGEVYDMITSVLAGSEKATCFSRIGSRSISGVFFPMIARLLVVMEKLPPIVEDVSVVFANLCDLYFTTIFRICTGSHQNERILLGVDSPTTSVSTKDLQVPAPSLKPEMFPSSPPLFGFRRRSSSSLSGRGRQQPIKVDLPDTLEADLCAPLMAERSKLSATRDFITRAQKTLASIVLLDKVDQWLVDPVAEQTQNGGRAQEDDNQIVRVIKNLEQRIGAAWSCLGVAIILDATSAVALAKLSSCPQALDDISTFQHYSQAALQMVPDLIRLASRISTTRAVMARSVVTEVVQVGPGWETDQMNEHANDYVDSLSSRCSCIWAALSVSPNKLPVGLLRETWKGLIEGGYASLLEGFSRVPYCSTEGRALMSMDLASFAAGIHPSAVMERLEYQIEYEAPPKTEPDNGMRYVDTYVKAFYYPKKDVMNWIIENHEKYHLNHFLKLAAYSYRGNEGEGASVEEALELVRKMFHEEQLEDNSKTAQAT